MSMMVDKPQIQGPRHDPPIREIQGFEVRPMTHQLDLIGLPLDAALTRHITGKISFPVPRLVRKPRLHDVLGEASRFDVGHELILAERARSDQR